MTALALFAAVVLAVMAGYPVAFTLAGVSLLFALIGSLTGAFEPAWLRALDSRIFGVITNGTLVAAPLFIFMGVVLQRSRIAERLLGAVSALFGGSRGSLAVAVVLVGALLAASTGIVGATVVTMGLLSLPVMLRRGYNPSVACGTICAAGTLGQIIPPSIVLILLGDVLSSAYQKSQLDRGVFSPETVSVADLFAASVLPGLLLVGLYAAYILLLARARPHIMPAAPAAHDTSDWRELTGALVAPLLLIVAVLGAILAGVATPTEAAAVGAVGAWLLCKLRRADIDLGACARDAARITCMVFMILIGASLFSLVFRGYGGDDVVHEFFAGLPGGAVGALLAVMLLMFLLGFVLDFIEIILIVVPIVGPPLMALGIDPVWLGVMIAINLQTSFLTPPLGFSLFYLRGVAPASVSTAQIYAGAAPFVGLQLLALLIIALWPALATWLPRALL